MIDGRFGGVYHFFLFDHLLDVALILLRSYTDKWEGPPDKHLQLRLKHRDI